ncbi:MAG: hypothetical protein HY675_19825 [Chloroflexi bacterium]|nr:hypothetical protein [Chloroflexota bacterium]
MKPSKALGLFLLILFSYLYFFYLWSNANVNSHLNLAYAIVDQHTLSIDAYHLNTIDKAFHKGHFYSDKAVGASLLATPFYAAIRAVGPPALAGGGKLDFFTAYLITFLVIGIPSAIFGSFFYRFLEEMVPVEYDRMTITIGYALGTMAYPFSIAFFSHQLAAILLFSSFMMLYLVRRGRLRLMHVGVAGTLAGYGVITEYPATIAALVLGLYILPGAGGRKRLAIFVAGAVPWIVLAATYNTVVFGSPLSQGYASLAGAEEFIEEMGKGLMGITYPRLDVLYNTTFSTYRGLFYFSPFLILTPLGLYVLYRRRDLRIEFWMILFLVLIYPLYNSAYAFWHGGASPGPRHLTIILPFMALACGLAVPRQRILASLMVAVSVLFTTLVVATNPTPPTWLPHPLLQLSVMNFLSGNVTGNWGTLFGLDGASGLIPLGAVWVLGIALLYRRSQAGRASVTASDSDRPRIRPA